MFSDLPLEITKLILGFCPKTDIFFLRMVCVFFSKILEKNNKNLLEYAACSGDNRFNLITEFGYPITRDVCFNIGYGGNRSIIQNVSYRTNYMEDIYNGILMKGKVSNVDWFRLGFKIDVLDLNNLLKSAIYGKVPVKTFFKIWNEHTNEDYKVHISSLLRKAFKVNHVSLMDEILKRGAYDFKYIALSSTRRAYNWWKDRIGKMTDDDYITLFSTAKERFILLFVKENGIPKNNRINFLDSIYSNNRIKTPDVYHKLYKAGHIWDDINRHLSINTNILEIVKDAFDNINFLDYDYIVHFVITSNSEIINYFLARGLVLNISDIYFIIDYNRNEFLNIIETRMELIPALLQLAINTRNLEIQHFLTSLIDRPFKRQRIG